MDVQHPAFPGGNKRFAKDAHISGERDKVGARLAHRRVHDRIVIGAGQTLVRAGEGSDALGRGKLQAGGFGIIGGDEDDLKRTARRLRRVQQRCHIRAAARQQDGDLGSIAHSAEP